MTPTPPKILFVDDDEFVRKIYADRLKASGFDLTFAVSGAEAEKEIASKTFDIICLDYVLVDKTGLEVLNWIRKERNLTTPVVVFSASGHEHKIEEFMAAGATEYVQKDHVVPSEFVEKLKKILKI